MSVSLSPKFKSEGFEGQKLIAFPHQLQRELARNCLVKSLVLSHIGYFPKAENHQVERPDPQKDILFICCHSGGGWCEIDGQRQEIRKKQFFLIPAQTPHRYGATAGHFWEVTWIHFRGTSASDLAEVLCGGEYGKGIPTGNLSKGMTVFSDIISLLERGVNLETGIHACMRIWYFFSEVIRASQMSEPETTSLVKRTIDLMNENVEEPMNLTEVSARIGITPPYMCRVFKQQTGQSPMDFFTRLKVQRACKYLDLTEMKVREISGRLGFRDPYYFSRLFKRIMQCSPAQYRKRSKG